MVVKNLKIIGILLIGLLILGGCGANKEVETSSHSKFKIGVTQIVEHPALDGAREGFIAAFEEAGLKDKIDIEVQNAQGDIPTTQTIAQNFVSSKKDMILAIATPSAQSAFNVTKDIPIVITAVTDPVEAGLADSLESSNNNVTGTSDMTPIKRQFELLKELVPDAKKVGVIFNTSEANSEVQVKMAEELSKEFNMELVKVGITNVNEISQGLESIIKDIHVLYVPTDNMVASAMPLVAEKCIENKVPVIGAEKAQVEGGALATEGIDYFKLGFQTGKIAIEVMNGKKPSEISIGTLKDTQLVINEDTAKKLNLEISEDLLKRAELVKGGK
ncbi:MAG: ABC transporter substrate-binding protein [Anaeromicrobium sp.]|jgi:putative ABC transport system substrate-binding protein|uniref:ABC transporter substrate-binding protein n=1 Tax=Anaeromicrobium sp. TaxID=1929132 RepID=UPI0025F4C0C1|nr:ABC transporter substrate-binding protein [Anaeromicrobium sp.]MCT4592653.1 ABC transporter substrate-binding protein [Anaeromicrobium sp.]